MAQYTEADIQNALADIENGVAIATAATRQLGYHIVHFATVFLVLSTIKLPIIIQRLSLE